MPELAPSNTSKANEVHLDPSVREPYDPSIQSDTPGASNVVGFHNHRKDWNASYRL